MSDGDWIFQAADVSGDYSIGTISPFNGGGLIGATQGVLGAKEGMSTIVGSARALGMGSDGLLGPLEDISAALQITAGAYQLYKGVSAMITTARTVNQALAAAEGAAAVANPFMWPNLIIAGAAMGAVYSTFKFASGDWTFPSVDISSVSGRNQAANRLTEVRQ